MNKITKLIRQENIFYGFKSSLRPSAKSEGCLVDQMDKNGRRRQGYRKTLRVSPMIGQV